MNNIKLVLDSAADLTEMEGIDFAYAPLTVVTAEKLYVDTPSLDVSAMTRELSEYNGRSSTSCPNADDWLCAFGNAERIICITITGGLSGSYNSACAAREIYLEDHPDRQVEIIDSLSAGPEITLMAEKARRLILNGLTLENTVAALKHYKTELSFILSSLHNFACNGRVSKLTAAAAGVLGIRIVGRASDGGTLEPLSKCRGASRSSDTAIEHMKKYGYNGGRVIISHCLNPEGAEALRNKLLDIYPSADISVRQLRGLCSFYAEINGILIGYEV